MIWLLNIVKRAKRRVVANLSPALVRSGIQLHPGEVVTIVYSHLEKDSDAPTDATIVRQRTDVPGVKVPDNHHVLIPSARTNGFSFDTQNITCIFVI